jgi:hypothetical protein
MRFMFRKTLYSRKLGLAIGHHAAYHYNVFYKYLIWIWLWNRVLAIFLIKEES